MAIQEDTSADRRKSIDATNELATINLENMQNNTRVINYCRTFMSIIGGVIAGIFGFTGLTGFVFYFIVMAITSAGLAAKAEFSVHSYFDSWNRITLDGFLDGLMSFVLFWTVTHNLLLKLIMFLNLCIMTFGAVVIYIKFLLLYLFFLSRWDNQVMHDNHFIFVLTVAFFP